MLESQLADLVNAIIKNEYDCENVEIRSFNDEYMTNLLYNSLSGLANTVCGGIILFGIKEDSNHTIIGIDNIEELKKDISGQSKQMQPIVNPIFTQTNIQGKDILSVEIAECSMYEKPCYYKGKGLLNGSYIWANNQNRHMSEYEIYKYKSYQEKIYADLREIEADISEITTDNLIGYIEKVRKKDETLMQKDDMYIMDRYGIIKNNKPTMAGLFLFNEYPQKYFPQLCIIIVVVKENKEQDIECFERYSIEKYKRVDGDIMHMLDYTIKYIEKNSKLFNGEENKKNKIEYPIRTVYETIFNALVHRDYSIYMESKPVKVILFDDKIEVESPGGLYGVEIINKKNMMFAENRNPYLLKLVEVMGKNDDNRFGLIYSFKELHKRGLHPPIFENKNNHFKVSLYKKLIFSDEMPMHKGGKTDEDIRKMITFLCKEPKSREELARILGFDSPYYMVTRYLRPLIEEGVLKMTLPNTPKSKNQRYYSE